ncbi:MAG TPA: vWA domain-containing protein, partial [Kofleriaceae bacterium]|nr:vWA domain-containing protein [Kofleriaceae bacterium]
MRSPSCFKPGSTLAAASVLALLVLPACPNRQVAEVDPDTVGQGGKTVSVNVNRNVDILFVIDNSSSMAEEQQSLADNFDKFIEVLSSVDGGLPSVHIGVISTDMGAEEPGGFTTVECKGTGDEGRLQAAPQVGGCTPPSDSYISDIKDEDTGDRTINYPKDQLAETFSCIARLGTGGCVFEQTLESMRAALDPDMNLNPGFLRDDAYLGIVFITDEDDCSASDPHIFNGDPDLSNKDSDVGFYASYRCFEFGVQCDPTVGRDPAS